MKHHSGLETKEMEDGERGRMGEDPLARRWAQDNKDILGMKVPRQGSWQEVDHRFDWP